MSCSDFENDNRHFGILFSGVSSHHRTGYPQSSSANSKQPHFRPDRVQPPPWLDRLLRGQVPRGALHQSRLQEFGPEIQERHKSTVRKPKPKRVANFELLQSSNCHRKRVSSNILNFLIFQHAAADNSHKIQPCEIFDKVSKFARHS